MTTNGDVREQREDVIKGESLHREYRVSDRTSRIPPRQSPYIHDVRGMYDWRSFGSYRRLHTMSVMGIMIATVGVGMWTEKQYAYRREGMHREVGRTIEHTEGMH